VPAEAIEQIGAFDQRVVQVEAGDAPARALADVAVEGDEKRRSPVPLHYPRRHDADHARVPPVAGDDEPRIPVGIAGALDHLERLVQDPLVERLALDVEPLEALGQPGGLVGIVGEQQPEPVGGLGDPPGRVQPRTDDEPAVPRPHLLAGQPARLQQGAEPGPVALGQQPEAVLHQDAVFALERHHVGHGGERDEIEQVVGKVGRQIERGDQRLDQLERHPGATEHGGTGGVARLLGIDHCERRRQLGARQMVISDDHPDPGPAPPALSPPR
jgi:hypothetical protein